MSDRPSKNSPPTASEPTSSSKRVAATPRSTRPSVAAPPATPGWWQLASIRMGGALRLGEEFHHGGSIGKGGCTQIPRNDHGRPPASGRPWDRLRIAKTFLRFLASGAIKAEQLITAIVPAEEAAEAYRSRRQGGVRSSGHGSLLELIAIRVGRVVLQSGALES